MLTCATIPRAVCAGCRNSLGVTPGTDTLYHGAWVLVWDAAGRRWYHARCEPRALAVRRTRPAPRRS